MRAATTATVAQNAHRSRREGWLTEHAAQIGRSRACQHGRRRSQTEQTAIGALQLEPLRRQVLHSGRSVPAPRQRRSRPQSEQTALGSTYGRLLTAQNLSPA